MSVQILEDIEEAIAREVRRISFSEDRHRTTTVFKELFNPFTGELIRKPIEPRFYDEEALPGQITYPRFTISLLKLYEDLYSKRTLPSIGSEVVETLPSPQAYEIILGGHDLITTSGSTGSDILIQHRKIRQITEDHLVRIITGNNRGTYRIDSITLNGNGPHTITLSQDLADELPQFSYNPHTGIVTFRSYIDLTAVKIGDNIEDSVGNSSQILAVNVETATINIGLGQSISMAAGAKIVRTGDVLTQDDQGENQSYLILDPSRPVTGKASKYRQSTWAIPYSFLYYIKIVSTERDDHIATADRMMHVFNPPRGSLNTIVRTKTSAEDKLKKDALPGDTIIFVEEHSSKFYPNEHIRLFDEMGIGEELVIESVNQFSNAITVREPIKNTYKITSGAAIASNYHICSFERDFQNHVTDDDSGGQYWVHRFTYRIEAWVESRISPYTTEQTFEDTRETNFIQAALQDFEGNPQCDAKVEVP